MVAVEHAERRVDAADDGGGEPSLHRAPAPVQRDEGILDGWIASLTPDQFERVLTALARVCDRDRGAAQA